MEILDNYKKYLEARNLSINYYNIMKQLLAYLQEKGIEFSAITQENITELFTIHSEYSTSTKNSWIKSARNFALFLGISDSAFTHIKLMKTDRKIPDYLTEEDLTKAIKYMATYHSDLYSSDKISAILLFLFYTGVRKGELLHLQRKDINLEEGIAKIWGEKSKTERLVHFPAIVKNALIKYFKQEEEKNLNAFNLTIRKIDYTCVLLRKYLPNKKFSIHTWRHSSARHMVEKGIPIGIISKLLGHRSLQTTLIYIDPDSEQIKRIYREKIK